MSSTFESIASGPAGRRPESSYPLIGLTPAESARRWRENLPQTLRTSATQRGLWVFATYFFLYHALLAGAFWLPQAWQRLTCIAIQPLIIGGLFVVGHDAAHHSLVPQGWLNRLLGRLALLPAWHPFTAWCYSHNTLHHGGTNLRGRHPDFVPLTKAEYDALPAWRRAVERIYRAWWGTGLCFVFDFYLRYLIFPQGRRRAPDRWGFQLDRLLVVAYFVLQMGAGYGMSLSTPDRVLPPLAHAALAVIVPWAVWIWFIGFMSYIQHTHPQIAWYDDREEWSYYHVQLKSTTHMVFPWPIEILLNNITDHAAHHLDPTIPLYHLPESQKLLEEECPQDAVVVNWTPWQYLETCRACKLYDFDRHCWTDFAGRATSDLGLPDRPFRSA